MYDSFDTLHERFLFVDPSLQFEFTSTSSNSVVLKATNAKQTNSNYPMRVDLFSSVFSPCVEIRVRSKSNGLYARIRALPVIAREHETRQTPVIEL